MNESNTISIVAICIAGLSLLVSAASCVFAYFQTQKAEKANEISQEANRIARDTLGYTRAKDANDEFRNDMEKSMENPAQLHRPFGGATG